MTRFDPERSGLPKRGPKTAETSFIEGEPSGQVMTADSLRIQTANETLKMDYPQYGKDGKLLTLEVARGKVIAVGKRGGRYPFFKADGRTINPKLPKEIMNTLGPHWTELIEVTDKEIEELDKTLQEDTRVANNENEEPSALERAREKITEDTERRTQLEIERERIVEKLPFREKIKEISKKHGFTIATIVSAVGLTIGVLFKNLKDGASAATNGIKDVSKKVGDSLKELGKKMGSILPGLVGAIASFVFRAAGQVISFLGKNAWLLILFVAAFLIEKLTKKRRE